jgi:hypothetical protein
VAAVQRIFRAVAVSAIRKRRQEPVDTEFLVRRIGQLWAEAANLPEKSPVQERIAHWLGNYQTMFRVCMTRSYVLSGKAKNRAVASD